MHWHNKKPDHPGINAQRSPCFFDNIDRKMKKVLSKFNIDRHPIPFILYQCLGKADQGFHFTQPLIHPPNHSKTKLSFDFFGPNICKGKYF